MNWHEVVLPTHIPYLTVELNSRKPQLDFFQVLHYVLAKHGTFERGDHSFIPIVPLTNCVYYNALGYGRCGWHYIPWSIAAKKFFEGTRTIADEVGDNCPVMYGYGNTTGAIHSLLTKWNLEEPKQKTPEPPTYAAKEVDDLLDEKWTHFYAVNPSNVKT